MAASMDLRQKQRADIEFLVSEGTMSLPIIYTPITKLTAPWDGYQAGVCGDFSMDYVRCATRVGSVRAQYDCSKELADFTECIHKSKQFERVKIMERERRRQNRTPIEPLAKDIPAKDVY